MTSGENGTEWLWEEEKKEQNAWRMTAAFLAKHTPVRFTKSGDDIISLIQVNINGKKENKGAKASHFPHSYKTKYNINKY